MRKGSHTQYDIKYHIVWITKYRYKILNGKIAYRLRELLRQGCEAKKIIIVPSDVPLIGKTNVQMLIDASKSLDFIIVPSKGGGTNMIIMKPMAIHTRFEGFSY